VNSSLLATKFYIPPPRLKAVNRTALKRRLSENLVRDEGFARKLTLVSAPAGFGKTSLVGEWLATLAVGTAWLSLDEKDNDSARFLAYLVSALQTVEPTLGAWVLDALEVPQPPSLDTLLTSLVNDLAGSDRKLILVLDDYHSLNSPSIDGILVFLIDNLPPRVHLVLVTREDPVLPLARYRARGQMTELRAKDLKFSYVEVEDFFGRVMGISLRESDIVALEARTEGWAAGLQFAALALQGNKEQHAQTDFIASFKGSHRFVLDYLVEEVLSQCSDVILNFLLVTSCLGRFCGSLCDAVLESSAGTGRDTLEVLNRSNLFLVPLDDERNWYRYHHLFAELLQQRLATSAPPFGPDPALIHSRASLWFERNDYWVEAFRHAAASGDAVRAEVIIEHQRMPVHTRGVVMEVIDWLIALPDAVKNARPSLWVKSAGFTLLAGLTTGVEEWLQAAESALQGKGDSERILFGQIATNRATLAVSQYRTEDAKAHAQQALQLLSGDNSTFRLAALWCLGMAHHFGGERTEARRILGEVLSESRSSGAVSFQILSALALGVVQENDNQLYIAAETFRHAIQLSGQHPQPNMCVAYQGLARIHYQWNELDKAAMYGEQGLLQARQYDSAVDLYVSCGVFLAKLEMETGQLELSEEHLDQAEQAARKNRFLHRIPEIKSAQALLQLKMGHIPEEAGLPPPVRIRILLASGKVEDAVRVLDSWTVRSEDQDEWLQALILHAVVMESIGNHEAALAHLDDALCLAEGGGFLRLFTDEGKVMRSLVQEAHERGILTEYTEWILSAFPKTNSGMPGDAETGTGRKSTGQLSDREREVLLHLAKGLSNQDIADTLFISLHTVKVHVRNIFDKLGTQSRTAAAAKGHSLGLLP